MFSKPIPFLSILGFQLKLDLSWLLIAALIVWSLSSNYFPAQYPGFQPSTYLALSVIGMLGLFVSLVIHELSHALVARKFGLGVGGITLFLFGGVAELEGEPESAVSEFWIAIVGPVTSFALAAMFWFMYEISVMTSASEPVSAVIGYLATINLILAVFNLLPAFPLDGGRVLRAFLWRRSGEIVRATQIACLVSTILAYMLIGLGFLALFSGAQIGGIWQVLIGLFVLFAARGAYQDVLSKTALKGRKVRSIMSLSPQVVAPSKTLSQLVDETMLEHSVSFVPVVDEVGLLGYIDHQVLKGIDRENWANTQVGDVFVALEADQVVSPDLPANQLIEKVKKTARRKFMVVEAGQLLGVVSLSDLAAFLAVFIDVGAPGLYPQAGKPHAAM